MIRKSITLICIICAMVIAGVPAYAQMSDEAAITYIKSETAAGKSQRDIAKQLAARGISKEQAERIKAKLEQQNAAQTEAGDINDTYEYQRRTNNKMLETESEFEIRQKANKEQSLNTEYGVTAENADVIYDTLYESPTDLEQEDEGRKVYGRDIFTSQNLTFAPSDNMPTPTNYTLGPGDEVIIDIWGANEETIRRTISQEGTINIPNIGLVHLNGMTIKQADSYLTRKLGQIYSVDGEEARSQINLSLGNIRTIQVNMMGEVANPGTYYLSSLSNLYHALHKAGGVSDLGSLRNIQLIRNGNKIANVDIYEFIREGKMTGNMVLEEGDIINVPAYDIIVDITGNIKRPMAYELKEGETVANLIDYAAGFAGDAYSENIRMIRRNGIEQQIFTVNKADFGNFQLMEGDSLVVEAMRDRFENRIEITGAVYRPGTYELGKEIHSVRTLIAKADGLKGDAFTNRALITRERDDLTLEMIQVDLKAVLNGNAPDVELERNDVLYIPSIHDLEDIGDITVEGEVAKPGQFVFVDNTTLEDAIMMAGGLLESASTARIDVSRRIKNPASMEQSNIIGEVYTFAFKDGYILDGKADFILEPYDKVFVRRSPGYVSQANVTISGEVVFPGDYNLTQKEERLSNLVQKAGGLNNWAYVKGAKLLRKMNEEEKRRLDAVEDMTDNIGDEMEINDIDRSTIYSVGIDLEQALANPGSDADLVLREGDQLIIPEYLNTVKISGNVMFPNTVVYNPDMTVKDYVQMAGGYGFRSKKNKSYVIYLNGTIQKASQNSKNVIEPGCEIVVPEKRKRDSNINNVLGIATTAATLGTTIATIGNLLLK